MPRVAPPHHCLIRPNSAHTPAPSTAITPANPATALQPPPRGAVRGRHTSDAGLVTVKFHSALSFEGLSKRRGSQAGTPTPPSFGQGVREKVYGGRSSPFPRPPV